MALWIIAGMTFREAARKKILWTALLAGLGFFVVFGLGLHYQMADFSRGSMSLLPAVSDFGRHAHDRTLHRGFARRRHDHPDFGGHDLRRIDSGTIHAIATKPIARWQVLVGKWMGFVGMLAIYVALMFGGTIAEAHWIGGVVPQNPVARCASWCFWNAFSR